jgi:hypothetical protein
MKFLLLVYNEEAALDALPEGRFDSMMHDCLVHADELAEQGTLLGSQQLEPAASAKSVRIRSGRTSVVDGPFAETKEILGGYNIIEAADIDEAVRIAAGFPWATTGCIEVRPIRDIDAVRRRVGVAAAK